MEKLFPPMHIFTLKGGLNMAALWWITVIGFICCLGIFAGTWVYFLKNGLNSEDATRVDPNPSDDED